MFYARFEKFIRLLFYPSFVFAVFSWPKFSVTAFLLGKELKNIEVEPNTIIDVGANVGQFAIAALKTFPGSKVHSFEPQRGCIEGLKSLASKEANLTVYPYALGDEETELVMNVNRHTPASSFLELNDKHLEAFPDAVVGNKETLPVKVLDNVIDVSKFRKPILMKIDVQGFESKVLSGSKETLKETKYVLMETSFHSLYKGESNLTSMIELMGELGFELSVPLDFLRDPISGGPLQADFLFVNRSL